MPLSLTLTFEGRTVTFTADDKDRFSLNELHQLSGTSASKRPGSWLRRSDVTDLIEKFSTAQIRAVKTVEGRVGGGTWAVKELIYAYALWISTDFYKAVLESFSAAVDGDGEKAVKKAQSVARIEGIPFRKQFTSSVSLATYGGGRAAYRLATNKVYVGLFNKTADSLRTDFGLAGRRTPRDEMGDDALGAIQAVEALSAIAMRLNHETGERRWERVVDHVLDNVKTALGLSPSKFLDAAK